MAIAGIDVSHYQGRIDWERVRKDSIQFAILKASEGTTFVDGQFARNRREAAKHGVLLGAYHFVRAGQGAAQARHFLELLRRTGGTEGVGLVLDQETAIDGSHPGRADTAAIVAELRRQTSTDRPVTLYTGRWYWHGTIGDPDLTGLDVALWESRYVNAGGPWRRLVGRVQSGWYSQVRAGGLKPSLIQYSSRGRVAGISGDVDLDHYPGTLAQLRELLIGGEGEDEMTKEEFAAFFRYALGGPSDLDAWHKVRQMAAEGFIDALMKRGDVQAKLTELASEPVEAVRSLSDADLRAIGDAVVDEQASRLKAGS